MSQNISTIHSRFYASYSSRIIVETKKIPQFEDKIDNLGYTIKPGKFAIFDKVTDYICSLKQQAICTELISFFGLCNVSCRYVPGLVLFRPW